MEITQLDVARKAKVSRQLVSLALSGDPSVAPRTRVRIAAAAAKLGYSLKANSDARVMVARRHGRRHECGSVAAILPCDSSTCGAWQRSADLISGLEAAALERGLDLLFCGMHGAELPRIIANQGVDGVVTLVGCPPDIAVRLRSRGIRSVALGFDDATRGSVVADYAAGVALAVRTLAANGHQRIAYLGYGPQARDGTAGVAAFHEAMSSCNRRVEASLVEASCDDTLPDSVQSACRRLSKRLVRATALVCVDQAISRVVARSFPEHGAGNAGATSPFSVAGSNTNGVGDAPRFAMAVTVPDAAAMAHVALAALLGFGAIEARLPVPARVLISYNLHGVCEGDASGWPASPRDDDARVDGAVQHAFSKLAELGSPVSIADVWRR